jgi:hypothetical protein
MPKMLIVKHVGFVGTEKSIVLEAKAGSIGICDGFLTSQTAGIEDCLSENKIEGMMIPVGGKLHYYDNEWEHQMPSLNPNDFQAPHNTLEPELAGSWGGGLTQIGRYPVPNTWNDDIDGDDTSVRVYDNTNRGVGGFNKPGTGGLIMMDGEVCHYGKVGDTSYNALARGWGSGFPVGIPHYGHDYVTNPNPPPATILDPRHDEVRCWYPGRSINNWMAASFAAATSVTAPVNYTPKGGKCGVFMPIILRFLSMRRRRASGK